jgi:hypothetical protein
MRRQFFNPQHFGLIVGLILGWSLVAGARAAWAPTPVNWDGSACPDGRATITTTATAADGTRYQLIDSDVVLPKATVTQSFPNLPAQSYTVRASVLYDGGGIPKVSQTQFIAGLGDAPVPLPSPTPTGTPTPTPTPTPPPPSGQQSPNCTKATTITDATGGVWTADAGSYILRNGVRTVPLGAVGTDRLFLWSGGHVYALGTDANWYRFAGPDPWVLIGPTEPACQAPSPTPTPTPTPAPISDLSQILAAMQAQTQTLLAAIMSSHQPPPVIPTIPCTIVSMGSYANGDQKPTLRCPPSGLANGQAVKVIK